VTTEADPRFQRSREAIVNAARELLLAHGPAAVTHNQIAELAEAMATVRLPFFDGAASPYRGWLTRELTALARQLDQHDVRAVTTTLSSTALWDTAMDARRAGFAEILSQRLSAALAQAEKQGEFSPRTDAANAAALAIGPLYYRATIERAVADASLIEQCVVAAGTWHSP
jgi:hypothetical protein